MPVPFLRACGLLLACAASGAGVAACGEAPATTSPPAALQSFHPVPPSTVPSQPSAPAGPAGPVMDDTAAALSAVAPCELLNGTDRSTAGLTSMGTAEGIGPDRACDWTETGQFGVTVTVDEREGLADLRVRRRTATDTTIGRHRALRVADETAGDGTCSILLGVGARGSVQVDVSNTNFTGTDLACRRAGTVAGLVEPKLP